MRLIRRGMPQQMTRWIDGGLLVDLRGEPGLGAWADINRAAGLLSRLFGR